MRIVAHTKYGVFNGKEVKYTEQSYQQTTQFLEKLHKLEYFSFETHDGNAVYMTSQIIADSLFVLEK